MSTDHDRLVATFEREFRTVVRTRVYAVVALGFALSVLTLAIVGGVSSYVGVVLDLVVPLEVLVPVLSAAFGYRALLADERSGELPIVRTFPLGRTTYVAGILLARAVAVVVAVLVPLLVLTVTTPLLTGGSSRYLLRQTTYDGPVLFVRFTLLTLVASVVFLAAVLAVSAVARRTRSAIALVTVLLVALTVGLDLLIVSGYALSLFSPETLPWLLPLSPASAYRGLVYGLVIDPATAASLQAGSTLLNAGGLLVWFLLSVAGAVSFVWE